MPQKKLNRFLFQRKQRNFKEFGAKMYMYYYGMTWGEKMVPNDKQSDLKLLKKAPTKMVAFDEYQIQRNARRMCPVSEKCFGFSD